MSSQTITHAFHDDNIYTDGIVILPSQQAAVVIEVDGPLACNNGYLTEADLLAMLAAIKQEEKG